MLAEAVMIGGVDSAYRVGVKEEYNALSANVTRLEEFFATEQYQALPDLSRLDLMDQLHYMRAYRTILKQRLGLLERR